MLILSNIPGPWKAAVSQCHANKNSSNFLKHRFQLPITPKAFSQVALGLVPPFMNNSGLP